MAMLRLEDLVDLWVVHGDERHLLEVAAEAHEPPCTERNWYDQVLPRQVEGRRVLFGFDSVDRHPLPCLVQAEEGLDVPDEVNEAHEDHEVRDHAKLPSMTLDVTREQNEPWQSEVEGCDREGYVSPTAVYALVVPSDLFG